MHDRLPIALVLVLFFLGSPASLRPAIADAGPWAAGDEPVAGIVFVSGDIGNPDPEPAGKHSTHTHLTTIAYGSQDAQLIARRVRELDVYCEIFPFDTDVDLRAFAGLILSGGPQSVYGE